MAKKNVRRDERTYLKEVAGPKDPNLEQLKEEFLFSLNERDSSVWARDRLNFETRNCVWPGQSEDGRKWYARPGEDEVFPWRGASDARVNLVDNYITKHTAFLMGLWTKMRTRVSGTESNDSAWANRLTTLLSWLKYTQMTESRAEHELLANYFLERGKAVMGTFWLRQTQLQYQEMDEESLIIQCAQRGASEPEFLELPGMVRDPSHEGEAAALLGRLLEEEEGEGTRRQGAGAPSGEAPGSRRLERVVEQLRLQGYARWPRPVVTVDRPKVTAYCPNDDIFISPDAYRLEDANIFMVEVVREAKLRGMARDQGWDAAWTEQVLESQRGNIEFGGLLFNQRLNRWPNFLMPSRGQLDTRKLFLVVHGYRRLVDEEGVPGIYYTVFHPSMTETAGKHELLNYDHGQMPFTLFQRERRSRRIDDSRGYGELANTWQNQVKSEWDNRIDRASIATLPPSFYPTGEQPDKWGPGVQVPTRSPGQYGFFPVPGDPRGSKEVEESVRVYADEYFGFAHTPEGQVDAMAIKQKLADDFMAGESKVDTQILQLCQQFMADQFYFRVVGSQQGKAIHCTREEIQGKFDAQIGFAIENMDPEQKKAKLALMEQVLSLDTLGQVDRSESMVFAFEMLDPNLGERLLRPAQSASLAEIEDETNAAMKVGQGIQVPVKPGSNFQLRLKVLEQLFQSNAALQQSVRSNPQAQEALKQRVKGLQLALQNQPGVGPNAVIGRGGPAFSPKT